MRLSFMFAAFYAVSVPAPALSAAGDTEQAVLADCGQANVVAAAADSCLERARILDETNPSPQIESLIARLESRTNGEAAAPAPTTPYQEPADDRATEALQASSPPRPLGERAAETQGQPVAQSGRTAPSGESMDDNDMPPVDDVSPRTQGADEENSPESDNEGDDDEPPVDDAPHG